MTTTARILVALGVCSFLALFGVIFTSPGVTHKRTVQEADFWLAAGCDELCLHHETNATPRVTIDTSDLF